MTNNDDVARAGKRWAKAKASEREAMTALYEAIRAASTAGLTEVSISELAGVDRMTVRRALGKR
jgi:DNA-binding GntR family transcriptional regulator